MSPFSAAISIPFALLPLLLPSALSSHPPLSEVLHIFDPYRLLGADHRLEVLGGRCRTDVHAYVRGLASGAPWAIKMLDSTGRYSQGLFWGNGFWIGSNSLCREIDSNATETRGQANSSRDEEYFENPPMRVAFHIMKFRINLTDRSFAYKIPSEIFIGMCLPRSCAEADAVRLLALTIQLQDEARSPPPLPRVVQLLEDKLLSGEYSYWGDPRVYVMATVIGSVTAMTIAGTIYDLWLTAMTRRKKIHRKNSSEDRETVPPNCTTEKISEECNGNHIAYSEGPVCSAELAKSARMDKNITLTSEAMSLTKKGAEEGVEITRLPTNPGKDLDHSPEKKSFIVRFFLCFSALSNARSICSLSVGGDTIAPIHGLRFFSLLWVILAHTCLVAFQFSDNKNFRAKAEKDFLYQTLSSGTYSVDTFFFISGLLVSFLYFRTVSKYDVRQLTFASSGFKAQGMQFIGMVIYRFIRLTPPYMFVLGLVEVTMKYCHDHGSLEPVATDYINCPKYWWRNLLYINTMFPLEQRCMAWSWYLANDTQFYIVGTILLIIAVNHFWLAAGMVTVFMLSAWTTTAFVTIYTEHMPTIQDPFAHYDELYDKPWTRIGPYLVGMCLGWILFKTKCKMHIKNLFPLLYKLFLFFMFLYKQWVLALGWALSMIVMALVVYSLYFFDLGPAASAIYVSLSHTAWAVALAWIVIVCATGNGGYVNNILSWKYIYPVSRITYCSYLLHPVLMRSIACNSDSPTHIGRDIIAVVFLGYTVASYGFSFLISLAFEAPVVALLRLVHPLRRTKATA